MLFKNLGLILKCVGSNDIQTRLSKHIRREINDKNDSLYRKEIELKIEYLKID